MADFLDEAQSKTQLEIDDLLKNRVQFNGESAEFCENCGDDIPEKRRALGGVKYCVICQSKLERKNSNVRSNF